MSLPILCLYALIETLQETAVLFILTEALGRDLLETCFCILQIYIWLKFKVPLPFIEIVAYVARIKHFS